MTIKDLVKNLNGKILTSEYDEKKEIKGGFAGDLLSHCMGKAKTDGAWFTIMNNQNVAAVAVLCEVACVVLCEDIQPDESLKARAEKQGVCLISTPFSVFEACVASSEL